MSNELTIRQEATLRSYADSFLENTKADMLDISRSFFKIGFRLAEANKEGYYKTLGYESIDELAEAEFGIKRSTTYGLMEVWRRYHDDKNPMHIREDYQKFSYTKLLAISKERYGGAVYHINPNDSVRDIQEFIRFWNRYGDNHSSTPKENLKEWKEQEAKRKELEANSKQLEIEGEVVQTFGQQPLAESEEPIQLKEEVFEPEQPEQEKSEEDYIERARKAAHEAGIPFYEGDAEEFNPYVYDGGMSVEDYKLMHKLREEDPDGILKKEAEADEVDWSDMPMQTHSYDSDYSPDEESDEEEVEEVQEEVQKKEYDFSRRAGVRAFLKDYENWELFTKYTGCCFKDAKQYRLKNGVSILATPIEMFVGREELVKVTDVIYWLFEENWFKAVKITKDQIEAYVVKHQDEL